MSQFSRIAVALQHARLSLGLQQPFFTGQHPPIAVDLPFCLGYNHLIPTPEGWVGSAEVQNTDNA